MPIFNQNKINKLKKIDRLFKSIYLFPKNRKKRTPIIQTDVKEILIIGFLLIGDTIMYLPALRIIRKNFPNARITLVCENASKTILEDQDVVNDFILIKCPWIAPFDKSAKNMSNFVLSLKTVNRKKYDLAIDMRGDWRNIFYMNFITAERKVSYNFSGGEYMLTDIITPDPQIEHFTDEALYFVKQLGCNYSEEDKSPALHPSATDKEYVRSFKEQHNLDQKFIVGVHPGTSQEIKRWKESKYSELILRISKLDKKISFIIFEGPNERDTVQKIEIFLNENNIVYTVVNRRLKEYISLLSICNIIVCNDSGAAHIAGAFKVPSVIIFGNVDPRFVTPYGSKYQKVVSHDLPCKPCYQNICRYGTNECIAEVMVDEVYNSFVDIFDKLETNNNVI